MGTEQAAEVLTFDATALARGWLSVALAASKDKARPILYNTIHVEVFGEGVRLVATDSYILLRSWVSKLHSDAPEPGLDEAPTVTMIAHDQYGRGKNLLWHLLNLSQGEDSPAIELDLTVGDTEPDETQAEPSFDGMAKQWVTFQVPDKERLKLPTIDGEYPNWRVLDTDFLAVSTKAIGLAPEIIKRLASLEKTAAVTSLSWVFGGELKAARVSAVNAFPPVTGLVMPQRIDDWGKEPEADEVDMHDIAQEVVDAVNDGALGPDVTATLA